MGFNIKKLQDNGIKAVKTNISGIETFVNNTMDDIGSSIGHVSECAAKLDQIRILTIHRAIQYHTTMMQGLIDAELIPVELVEKVFNRLLGKLPDPRPPRLLKVGNPNAIWDPDRNDPEITTVDINNEDILRDHTPYIFVHGMMYKAEDSSAFGFYKSFELEAKMFKNDAGADYSKADIYLVSYDSDLSDELKLLIRRAIEAEVSDTITGGDAESIYLAILWRENIKRAEKAGEMLIPFFDRLWRLDSSAALSGMAISHSLGNFVIAKAAKEFLTQFPGGKTFKSWWCMAPALPADAFTNTGNYMISPKIAGLPSQDNPGTIVWFSRMDAVLSYIYPLANKYSLALGVTGALEHGERLKNLDVTGCTFFAHREDEGYFRLLGKSIRWRLGTEVWPGKLCEDIWPVFIEDVLDETYVPINT